MRFAAGKTGVEGCLLCLSKDPVLITNGQLSVPPCPVGPKPMNTFDQKPSAPVRYSCLHIPASAGP